MHLWSFRGTLLALWLTVALSLALPVAAAPRPTPTVKACHICEEQDAAWATATAQAMATPPATEPQQNEAIPTRLPVFTAAAPVVRGVMFWANGCPHCHEVLDNVLPPLQAQYGQQLQIHLIEVSSDEEILQFQQVAAALGVSRGQAFVPFLIIGEQVLIGSQQIPARLPGLIEQTLAAGGVDYPSLPQLAGLLPTTAEAASSAPAQPLVQPLDVLVDEPAAPPRSDGFALAIAIMAGMAAALVYVAVRTLRGDAGELSRFAQVGWNVLTPLLLLAGLGVALYLSYVETQMVEAVCGPVGDCNTVQSSPYARLFGVLPVGVLGTAGYVGILAAWLLNRLGRGRLAELAPAAALFMALFGVLFSLYLTYLEPFVIRAVCIWCLSSAGIITLLMLLSLAPALHALAPDDEEFDDEMVAELG